MNHDVMRALFQTEALKLAAAEQPFWYTSGKFGPFYINTHFLFGSETEANELLALMGQEASKPALWLQRVEERCRHQDREQATYRLILDRLQTLAKKETFDLISGGERRDYFFSMPLAQRLGCPHLAILKDGACYLRATDSAYKMLEPGALQGLKVLHVADLVTEASSYVRAWLPALEQAGAEISKTLAVVDRCQGGREVLARAGVCLETLVSIQTAFMTAALEAGLMVPAQLSAVSAFMADPDDYMHQFLATHPNFLAKEAKKDAKTAERVARCRALGFE